MLDTKGEIINQRGATGWRGLRPSMTQYNLKQPPCWIRHVGSAMLDVFIQTKCRNCICDVALLKQANASQGRKISSVRSRLRRTRIAW